MLKHSMTWSLAQLLPPQSTRKHGKSTPSEMEGDVDTLRRIRHHTSCQILLQPPNLKRFTFDPYSNRIIAQSKAKDFILGASLLLGRRALLLRLLSSLWNLLNILLSFRSASSMFFILQRYSKACLIWCRRRYYYFR